MEIRAVGIDLGKTTFHLGALGEGWQGAGSGGVDATAASCFHREHVYILDRSGSLLWNSLSGRILREQGHNVKLIPA